MAAQSDPARKQLADAYREFIANGQDVSLRRLSEISVDIVGKPIPYDLVKYWSREDRWMDFLSTSLGSSPDLRDTKILFDNAKNDLETKESWHDRASAVQSFLSLAKAIPDSYRLLIESDVSEVYDLVNTMLLEFWDSIPMTNKKTIVSARGNLKKLMDTDAQVESGGVSADAALLKKRQK